MLTRAKIVGGMFGLESIARASDAQSLLRPSDLLFVNARSAIHTLIHGIEARAVWLPTFLCESLIQATSVASRRRFYGVDEQLQILNQDWIDDIVSGDLVILVRFFGLPLDNQLVDALQRRGARVLEDASQVFPTLDDSAADFVVYSPRKFVGVPDGGILRCRDRRHPFRTTLAPPPVDWWCQARAASERRREFDESDEANPTLRENWFRLFRESESHSPCGPFAMSDLSRYILETALSPSDIQRRRSDNFRFLADALGDWGLVRRLPPEAAPIGYPIVTDHRESLRAALCEEEIFAPVHWPTPKAVPDQFQHCRRLAARILTLPCDQRLEACDLERVVEVVKRCLH